MWKFIGLITADDRSLVWIADVVLAVVFSSYYCTTTLSDTNALQTAFVMKMLDVWQPAYPMMLYEITCSMESVALLGACALAWCW